MTGDLPSHRPGRAHEESLRDGLVADGVVEEAAFERARAHAACEGVGVAAALAELGLADETDLTRRLAALYRLPAVDLDRMTLDPRLSRLLDPHVRRRYLALPVRRSGRVLTVAMVDPADAEALDLLRLVTRCEVEPILAGEGALRRALARLDEDERDGEPPEPAEGAEARPSERPERAGWRLENLGMSDDTLARFMEVLDDASGLVPVAGPTGSGKATLIYAALEKVNTPEVKVMTVEHPVRRSLPGVLQVPADPAVGVTFATALETFLRHDADVVYVNELRDIETAGVALEAALAGLLVFSTVHTNDAPSTVERLMVMGLDPLHVAAALRAVIAVRVLRRVCPECSGPAEPAPELLLRLSLDPDSAGEDRFQTGRGCDACGGTGYRGGIGVHELMVMNDELRAALMDDLPTEELRRRARAAGMRTLREEGLRHARQGVTTLEEVVRELPREPLS